MAENKKTSGTAAGQYIDLFVENRAAIDGHSAGALNALRDDALAALHDTRLPRKGDEDYEATDLESFFAPDYGINVNRLNVGGGLAEAFRCEVPNLSTSLFFLLNDAFQAGAHSAETLPDGVIVKSLRAAAEENADLVARYYGKLASLSCASTALNTLLSQDGVFVYIPKSTRVEKPIQIVNILNGGMPLMANRRMLIVVEDGAEVRILSCDHTQNAAVDFLNSQVVEVFVGRNAVFDYYDIEDSTASTRRVSSFYLRQESGSNVMVDGITLMNGATRNNFVVDLAGDHTELRLLGMAIADGDRLVDNHAVVTHSAHGGHTDELFKYVVDDRAVGAFSGLIKVCPGAEKTEAYQSNKNICASPTAKMYSKPQLLIDCDDVKCSHGSSTGQLDGNALFYMRSRGIPESEARLMLMQAFMHDVIDGVRLESLKERLRRLVEARMCGDRPSCRECAVACRNQKIK